MRKLLSVLLTLTIIMTIFSSFGATANAASYSKYKSKIKSAINTYSSCSRSGKGFLCDFDGNGVKELVMLYWKFTGDGYKEYLKVYTIKKNKVVTIMTKTVGEESGNGMKGGTVGVFGKNGKKYLMVQTEEYACDTYGYIKLYKISGSKKSLVSNGYGLYGYDFNKNKVVRKAKINGKSKTTSQYVKWQKSYKIYYLKRTRSSSEPSGYRYTSTAKSLSSLYYQL